MCRRLEENDQCNNFLNRLKLNDRKLIRADAVRRNLEAVLEECDKPAYENDFEQRAVAIYQVAAATLI